jgi:hypothetical protein
MKTILIEILSTSIGDTIASTPYISEYQKKNDCKIYYKINGRLIPFLENVYTNINFIDKKTIVEFDEEIILKYIFSKNVQGGFAEQLGFENPTYIRPKITIPDSVRTIKNKYITFGVHSTGQIRYWNHPTGIKSQPSTPNWNDLSGRLRKLGYTPVTVEKDELFVSADLSAIADRITSSGYEWRLEALNRSLGPLRIGNFIIVAARVEVGKTTFLASEVSYLAQQLPIDRPVVWVNNEEESSVVFFRIVQAALGQESKVIIACSKSAMEAIQH